MAPTPVDLSLLAEGRHERPWAFLGAHPDEGGTSFAVWAPGARSVSVAVSGLRTGAMSRLDGGVWHAYVRGARAGQRYRYRVTGADGRCRDKADPYASAAERPPGAASMIFSSRHEWADAEWMRRRGREAPVRPMSVYEAHIGSWRRGLSYAELAVQLADHVAGLGFTHVEFLPVMEHPYGGSWGYQITGYFAPTARFGDPDDFRRLVDHLHQRGIGVILDWAPAHFPRDEFGLARFDGTPLYEHADPMRGEHPDWGSLIFDYGRPEVRNFLIASALYWCEEFHADGLRVDAVASMLYLDYSRERGQWRPNERGGNENLEAVAFLRELNSAVHIRHADVAMIAEESSTWPGVTRPARRGGLGFDLKWNLGWMHDTLAGVSGGGGGRLSRLTLPGRYARAENWILPLSHDEVVHGKGSLARKLPGDRRQRVAGLRGLLAYMWAFPGRKLLFMGAELAPDVEWSEHLGLDWSSLREPDAAGLCLLLTDLNRVYRSEPALWSLDAAPGGFEWLVAEEARGRMVVASLRRGSDASLLASVTNFSGAALADFPVGLPCAGRWAEVINTDAVEYGGSGIGNLGEVTARAHPARGRPASAGVQLGPYATVWLRFRESWNR